MERSSTDSARKHDAGIQIVTCRMATSDLATRLFLQKCQKSDVPDNDHTKSLRVAVQGSDHPIHGEVSINKQKYMDTNYIQNR